MSFDVTATLIPLAANGTFGLTAEDLSAAFVFETMLDPGNEPKMRLAFKLFFFWGTLTEEDRAEVIHDVFQLVKDAREATTVTFKSGSPQPKVGE